MNHDDERALKELATIRYRLGCIAAMIATAFTIVFAPLFIFVLLLWVGGQLSTWEQLLK